MSLSLLTRTDLERLAKCMAWTERMMNFGTNAEAPLPDQRVLPPIRGYLLQDVHSNGSGLMQLVYRAVMPNATKISLVGTNYVATSAFKLNLYGVLAGSPTGTGAIIIATTPPIPVNSTAAALQAILLQTCQNANLPVGRNDISVTLGNPVANQYLVLAADPTTQPEVDPTTSPPQSYAGSWVVQITGALARAYTGLNVQVLQDQTAIMKGISAIVTEATTDLPGTSYQIVQDVLNRSADYPWKTGSLCVAVDFLGLGYGIIASDFREQTISVPTSSS